MNDFNYLLNLKIIIDKKNKIVYLVSNLTRKKGLNMRIYNLDAMQQAHNESSYIVRTESRENYYKQKVIEEKLSNGFYESQLKHYKKQKEMLLNQLENAKTDSEVCKIKQSLGYNQKNMEQILAILATVKQK